MNVQHDYETMEVDVLTYRGFTLIEWTFMAGGAIFAFILSHVFPKAWTLGNLPVSFCVGVTVFSGILAFIHYSRLKSDDSKADRG